MFPETNKQTKKKNLRPIYNTIKHWNNCSLCENLLLIWYAYSTCSRFLKQINQIITNLQQTCFVVLCVVFVCTFCLSNCAIHVQLEIFYISNNAFVQPPHNEHELNLHICDWSIWQEYRQQQVQQVNHQVDWWLINICWVSVVVQTICFVFIWKSNKIQPASWFSCGRRHSPWQRMTLNDWAESVHSLLLTAGAGWFHVYHRLQAEIFFLVLYYNIMKNIFRCKFQLIIHFWSDLWGKKKKSKVQNSMTKKKIIRSTYYLLLLFTTFKWLLWVFF